MTDRVEIRDRHGEVDRIIPIRRDEHDDTKWHLAEPYVVARHETGLVYIGGQVVRVLDPNLTPINTIFMVIE